MPLLQEQILETLFESASKIRLLKFFFRNPSRVFSSRLLRERVRLPHAALSRALRDFEQIALLKKAGGGWRLNRAFIFFPELHTIITRSFPFSRKKIVFELARLGKIRLVLLAGVFLNEEHKRVDILVVGDRIREARFEKFIAALEVEVGQTLSWTLLSADEYRYRSKMFDRFLRDVMEYSHEVLVDKVGLGAKK